MLPTLYIPAAVELPVPIEKTALALLPDRCIISHPAIAEMAKGAF
jgi:hypothetical protein